MFKEEVAGHKDSPEGEETELYLEEGDDNVEAAVVDDSAVAAAEESAGAFSEEEHEVVATVRYRASFTDVKKAAIASASFTAPDSKINELLMLDLWDDWADDVAKSTEPEQVRVASLTAVVYPQKAKVIDRLPQRLRRGNYGDLEALKVLATSIDRTTSERLCVDFNLILAKEAAAPASQPASQPTASQQPVPPRLSQPRARTATIIQEDGLLGVVAAEQMAAGPALVIKDQWRCEDRDCRNYPYVCWLPRTGQPARWESHYPVNANIIAMWAKAITERQCTVSEPNDRIKSAIMRARERSEVERVKRRQGNVHSGCSSGVVLDEVRELQKSVLMAQLQLLNGGTGLQSAGHKASQWVPFKYKFWGEIVAHTMNFFDYFKAKCTVANAEDVINHIIKTVVRDAHIDINMLMDDTSENGVPMVLWVEHFDLTPGMLLQLRRHALKWRKEYSGLSVEDLEKIYSAIIATKRVKAKRKEVVLSSSPREPLVEL